MSLLVSLSLKLFCILLCSLCISLWSSQASLWSSDPWASWPFRPVDPAMVMYIWWGYLDRNIHEFPLKKNCWNKEFGQSFDHMLVLPFNNLKSSTVSWKQTGTDAGRSWRCYISKDGCARFHRFTTTLQHRRSALPSSCIQVFRIQHSPLLSYKLNAEAWTRRIEC